MHAGAPAVCNCDGRRAMCGCATWRYRTVSTVQYGGNCGCVRRVERSGEERIYTMETLPSREKKMVLQNIIRVHHTVCHTKITGIQVYFFDYLLLDNILMSHD